MSKKLPVVKPKELEKALLRLGFYFVRQKGSHKIYRSPDGRWATVPFHDGEDISKGLLRKILNDVEVSSEELTDAL